MMQQLKKYAEECACNAPPDMSCIIPLLYKPCVDLMRDDLRCIPTKDIVCGTPYALLKFVSYWTDKHWNACKKMVRTQQTGMPDPSIITDNVYVLGYGEWNATLCIPAMAIDWVIRIDYSETHRYRHDPKDLDRLMEEFTNMICPEDISHSWILVWNIGQFHSIVSRLLSSRFEAQKSPHFVHSPICVHMDRSIGCVSENISSYANGVYTAYDILREFKENGNRWDTMGPCCTNGAQLLDEMCWQAIHTLQSAYVRFGLIHSDFRMKNALFQVNSKEMWEKKSFQGHPWSTVQTLQYVVSKADGLDPFSFSIPFRGFLFKLTDFDTSTISWESETHKSFYLTTAWMFLESRVQGTDGYNSGIDIRSQGIAKDVAHFFLTLVHYFSFHPTNLWDKAALAVDEIPRSVFAQTIHSFLVRYHQELRRSGPPTKLNPFLPHLLACISYPFYNITMNIWMQLASTFIRASTKYAFPFRAFGAIEDSFSFAELLSRYRIIYGDMMEECFMSADDMSDAHRSAVDYNDTIFIYD
jgi:hypothetical protein